jgi:hypothetical protein
MNDPPNIDQDQPEPAPSEADKTAYRNEQTYAALSATVEQHSAEIDALQVQTLILMFALGAIGGLLFVMHREVRALAVPD